MYSIVYYYFVVINLLLLLIFQVNCKHVGQREGRWFNGAYTSTVFDTSMVTSLVPSSCVQVEATLPPCRNVRYLKFPHFVTNTPAYNSNGLALAKSPEDSPIETTPLAWGEYLGIYAPTVTVTSTRIQTLMVPDPRIVVTFAVKGCRPIKLPMDLNRCPEVPQPSISIEEIMPTSTVSSNFVPAMSSTAIYNGFNHVGNFDSSISGGNLEEGVEAVAPVATVEGTSLESVTDDDDSNLGPTEALPVAVVDNNSNNGLQ